MISIDSQHSYFAQKYKEKHQSSEVSIKELVTLGQLPKACLLVYIELLQGLNFDTGISTYSKERFNVNASKSTLFSRYITRLGKVDLVRKLNKKTANKLGYTDPNNIYFIFNPKFRPTANNRTISQVWASI